ncbi:hypothetical protein [Rhodanobacter sp. C03]|uniref:hypothetical protein n=1 Tax=Rhodanobacter sp. C03 TaxID=1945858 RepID=UPI000984E61B|nr:hypothetical protein [Rhodanobacter sp. C03]OOG55627.1 hypothetical protein B0E48_13440 [Rhodanobacter sp. C03]
MLTIRQTQMDVLERAATLAFEDRTYAHLKEYFPGHCHLLGEKQMRRVIRYGWEKSKSYGFTAECCVRMYIEFMCLLGGGFDTDPLLPWAAEILKESPSADQVARGDRFYARAWEYIEHIIPDYRDASGTPNTARFAAELKQLRTMPDESLGPHNLPVFDHALQARLRQVFPAKCNNIGTEHVQLLVRTAIGTGAGYGITGTRGITLIATLMFVLGSGFERDPLLPWIAPTLKDRSIRTPTKRVDKLYLKALGVLGNWWDFAHQTGT